MEGMSVSVRAVLTFSNEAMLDELLKQKGMPTGIRRIGGNDYVKARLHASYAKSVKA